MTEAKEKTIAGRVMALFEGYSNAYGTYDKTDHNERKGKLEIKQSAKTLRSPVTRKLWEEHIAGRNPIGIIPIRDNNTCLWGCIDVDQYGLDHAEIYHKIDKNNLPMVVCRSKSGGAHIFLFSSEPVSAEVMIATLGEISAILGYGSSEIFPKQHLVHIDRGDLGSWLNMPYFGGDETTRYAVKKNGMAMTVLEFLAHAEAQKRKVTDDFYNRERPNKKANDPEWGDGPPCMQHLSSTGLPEGTRNQGLFAMGLFAKRKFGEKWVSMLETWNYKYLEPPLPSSEVIDIIKRLEKKDYQYPCRQQPLSSHCNSVLCRTRKYGVGGDNDYPVISGLSVLETDPPLWFLDVEDHRLELTTDEIMNYHMFQKVCMERMFRVYKNMKRETWQTLIAEQMMQVVRIEAPPEVGTQGRFEELLEKFCTDKHRAEQPEEMLLGKPFEDVHEGRYYFRLSDLEKFLEGSGFRVFNRGQMTTRIKNMRGNHKFFNFKGKGVNTWWVPSAPFQANPEIGLPKTDGARI